MQFKVPQFIDIEDKIFGPLTFKQFAYLAGGAGLSYLSLKIIPNVFGFMVALPIIGFSIALAFYRINEKPFIHFVESFLKYYSRSRLYLWQKKTHDTQKIRPAELAIKNRGGLTESKLQTLSWSLDVIDTNKK